jgi:hypothetical protein
MTHRARVLQVPKSTMLKVAAFVALVCALVLAAVLVALALTGVIGPSPPPRPPPSSEASSSIITGSSINRLDPGMSSIILPGTANVPMPSPSPPPPFQAPPPTSPPTPVQAATKPLFNIDNYIKGSEAEMWAEQARANGFDIVPTSTSPTTSVPAAEPPKSANFKYDYVLTLFKAFLFMEVQRGGTQAADGRTWRQDDQSKLDAGTTNGMTRSLDGGWWEAGSAFHVTWHACLGLLPG